MKRHIVNLCAAAAVAVLASAGAAQATTVTEHDGILDSFKNLHNDPDFPQRDANGNVPELNVQSATARYTSSTLFLSATMEGNITDADDLYVWGIDRGTGTDLFHNPNTVITNTSGPGQELIGEGVKFDAFLLLFGDGHGAIATLEAPDDHGVVLLHSLAPLDPGAIKIDGATISIALRRSLLPSTGFDFADFGYNIWPRYKGPDENSQIADFLPDNSTFKASLSVPEPASWALMIAGFGAAGGALRRRKVPATA